MPNADLLARLREVEGCGKRGELPFEWHCNAAARALDCDACRTRLVEAVADVIGPLTLRAAEGESLVHLEDSWALRRWRELRPHVLAALGPGANETARWADLAAQARKSWTETEGRFGGNEPGANEGGEAT